MENEEALSEMLAALMREVFDLPASLPLGQLKRENIPEWDSLRHVRLILELQKRFHIKFTAEEMIRLNSFSGLLAELKAKNASVSAGPSS